MDYNFIANFENLQVYGVAKFVALSLTVPLMISSLLVSQCRCLTVLMNSSKNKISKFIQLIYESIVFDFVLTYLQTAKISAKLSSFNFFCLGIFYIFTYLKIKKLFTLVDVYEINECTTGEETKQVGWSRQHSGAIVPSTNSSCRQLRNRETTKYWEIAGKRKPITPHSSTLILYIISPMSVCLVVLRFPNDRIITFCVISLLKTTRDN